MKNKLLVATVILLLVFVSFSGAKGQQEGKEVAVEEWEIPFLNSITGPIASIGEYLSWSADRAAEEINAAGGIAGKPVKILHLDTGVSPEKATVEMAKIADTALVAMGPVPEACILAAMPIAVKSRMMSMTSTTSYEYAEQFFPWSISWFPPTEQRLSLITTAWAKKNPEMKTVVQFIEKWATWPIMGNAHIVGLERAGVEVTEVEVPTDAVTFGPLVVRALAQKPDGLVLTCNSEKAARIIIELKKLGWQDMSNILVFSSADDAPLYTTGGKNIEGVMIYNYLDPESSTPRWLAFVEAYKADHNGMEPTGLATHYYDSVYMIKEAIEKSGVTGNPKKLKEERAKIRDYAYNVKGFEGIMYKWDMKDGVPTNKPIFLFRIEGGKKILVDSVLPDF